ncbi:hypothetical protein OG429_28675 [Streptomyces sp. NBC_00190]|uniref:hypothetical protein n=1 Tax=unclassified Streptomyces TaxID=2593676 RepID=UPI002E2BD0D3|nr:hypothetical protein [Streptomyces sp. NBC_00190]WSZ42906.1 hypothetical protein OG239_31320 [Streptomyces sp. NBC_00868]
MAVDAPLDELQMADVQMLSNWSCDSPKTLVASSVVRPFHTDPRALMERYFDVHLAVSPWGTREVIFRLPQECLSVPLARRYGVEAWSVDEHTLVVLRTDFAGGAAYTPVEDSLSRLASVRAELATGGRRALYLAWLASLGNPDQYGASEVQELEAEEEPPVPAGLTTLGPGLCALAEILCVDPRLLQVAGSASPDAQSHSQAHQQKLSQWIHRLPDVDKNRLLLQVLQGGTELPMQARRSHPPSRASHRSVADLVRAALAVSRADAA